MAFVLHPRLAAGGFEIGRISDCRLLLKNQALFPWFLLVPETGEGEEGVEDLHQLDEARFAEVMGAVRKVSQFVESHFATEKLNVASIGNQVRQMHIHIVGRDAGDAAWPGTVWAYEGKETYPPEAMEKIAASARRWLKIEDS